MNAQASVFLPYSSNPPPSATSSVQILGSTMSSIMMGGFGQMAQQKQQMGQQPPVLRPLVFRYIVAKEDRSTRMGI
jgi:hypothetical protein